jgi:molybdopterin/thiamine biosynthesis adenylyltransferase
MYLAGAGIGEIGVVDGDTVDLSNLHRQIIHNSNNPGVNKSKSAKMLIKSFNPNIKVNTYEVHLSNKNAITICSNYNLLIDCSDNLATRYLASDTAVALNIPLVSGSAVKWEEQLTVYSKDGTSKDSNKLPCYRCLFTLPTPTSAVCNCADAGVFGPVPGVIGTLQANKAVKLILGYLIKYCLKECLYDALEMLFKVFKIRNSREDCAVCGKEPKITKENISTYDYDEFVNPKENRRLRRLPIPDKYNIKWNDLLNSDNTNDNINHLISYPQAAWNYVFVHVNLNNVSLIVNNNASLTQVFGSTITNFNGTLTLNPADQQVFAELYIKNFRMFSNQYANLTHIGI